MPRERTRLKTSVPLAELDAAVDELAEGMYVVPMAAPIDKEFNMPAIFELLRRKRRCGVEPTITPEEAERLRRSPTEKPKRKPRHGTT